LLRDGRDAPGMRWAIRRALADRTPGRNITRRASIGIRADDFAAVVRGEGLVSARRTDPRRVTAGVEAPSADRFLDEPDRAVSHREIGPARVQARGAIHGGRVPPGARELAVGIQGVHPHEPDVTDVTRRPPVPVLEVLAAESDVRFLPEQER